MMTSLRLKQLLVYACLLVVIAAGIRAADEGSGEEREGTESEWDENPDYGGLQDVKTCPCDDELKKMMTELKNIRSSFEKLRMKIDPEFVVEPEKPEAESKKCPHGFHYLPLAKSCYRIVYEEHNWTAAGERCHKLAPGAHLVAITTADENRALKRYINWDLLANSHRNVCIFHSWGDTQPMLWTAGHRRNDNCAEPFVWQLTPDKNKLLSYSDWASGEPNCHAREEKCLHIRPRHAHQWNDIVCGRKICPVCEYDPPE